MAQKYNVILLDGSIISVMLMKGETRGSDLLTKVVQPLGLSAEDEKYFGLRYSDKDDGGMNWIAADDELKSLGKSNNFQLAVRFYPEHPEKTLKDDTTRRLFRSHLKDMLMKGEIGCCVQTHAVLDAYIVQAEIGSYNPSIHKIGYLKNIKNVEICAPTFLNSDTDIKETEYLRKVNWYHKRHLGVSSSDADIMFLSSIKKLPFCGIIIYKTVIHAGKDVCIGLSGYGIVIFDDKLNDRCTLPPVIKQYSWKELNYCLRDKNKVKLGIFDEDNLADPIVLKLKSKNSFKRAERLHKEILAFRDMFLIADETDFYTSKKIYKKVKRSQSARVQRPIGRSRFQSLSSNFQSSFRAKFSRSPAPGSPTPGSPTYDVMKPEQKESGSVDEADVFIEK